MIVSCNNESMQQWSNVIIVVIPTRNEATIIRENLQRLAEFLRANLQEDWRVIVADNGSTDATRSIVRAIAAADPRMELLEIAEPGKGRAVLTAWKHAVPHPPTPPLPVGAGETKNSFSPSTGVEGEREGVDDVSILIFMDADLATNLDGLPKLIDALQNGADIAIGSRYIAGARTDRSALRHIVSLTNRILLRALFRLRVTDPPCGFKAVNARVVREIVPLVRDTQWFFDTELLIRAQRAGMRIAEIPVTWREPRRGGSLRKVARITIANLHAIIRLHRALRDMAK